MNEDNAIPEEKQPAYTTLRYGDIRVILHHQEQIITIESLDKAGPAFEFVQNVANSLVLNNLSCEVVGGKERFKLVTKAEPKKASFPKSHPDSPEEKTG